jgi:hypothetical protein
MVSWLRSGNPVKFDSFDWYRGANGHGVAQSPWDRGGERWFSGMHGSVSMMREAMVSVLEEFIINVYFNFKNGGLEWGVITR